MAAYTRCLRCAGAPRRPASGSELSLTIPSWHAVLSDPGELDHRYCPVSRCRHGSSPKANRLDTPSYPAIRFARGLYFRASLVRDCYGLSDCLPPCTDQAGIHPQPPGTFTSRLPTGRSPFPPLDMTTTATSAHRQAGRKAVQCAPTGGSPNGLRDFQRPFASRACQLQQTSRAVQRSLRACV